MKLYTTINKVKAKGVCYTDAEAENYWNRLKKQLNIESENQPVNIADALPIVGIEDCVWALRTQRYKDICLFLADVVDMVLPIYMREYPSDRRPQRCISLIRRYAVGLSSKRELLEATDAAFAAFVVAAYVADATYDGDATYTATDAAAAAAYATAYATAVATAINAAAYAGEDGAWQQIEKLFIKHFGD